MEQPFNKNTWSKKKRDFPNGSAISNNKNDVWKAGKIIERVGKVDYNVFLGKEDKFARFQS